MPVNDNLYFNQLFFISFFLQICFAWLERNVLQLFGIFNYIFWLQMKIIITFLATKIKTITPEKKFL